MEILDEGMGELLAWCDPDWHREWVRKNRCLSMRQLFSEDSNQRSFEKGWFKVRMIRCCPKSLKMLE